MRATIILTLVLAIGLLVAGCAKTVPGQESSPQEEPTAEVTESFDNSISGEISSVDSLDLELDSSDLGDVDAQLDELDW